MKGSELIKIPKNEHPSLEANMTLLEGSYFQTHHAAVKLKNDSGAIPPEPATYSQAVNSEGLCTTKNQIEHRGRLDLVPWRTVHILLTHRRYLCRPMAFH